MTQVPVTQLGAMRDARRCVVLVRGMGDDVELEVSRAQFRNVLESFDDTGRDWTVCWVAETEAAVLEPRGRSKMCRSGMRVCRSAITAPATFPRPSWARAPRAN